MGLNFILLIVGLIVCFGGIYIRKACSALLGLIWGALCSFVVILMTVGLWGIDEEAFVIVAVCAVVCALISAIYDKLCAAINAFLSTFFGGSAMGTIEGFSFIKEMRLSIKSVPSYTEAEVLIKEVTQFAIELSAPV